MFVLSRLELISAKNDKITLTHFSFMLAAKVTSKETTKISVVPAHGNQQNATHIMLFQYSKPQNRVVLQAVVPLLLSPREQNRS